jgi:hypothetical protein
MRKMTEQNKTVMDSAYVAYFDILGFTSRFISGDLMHRYEKLINTTKEIKDSGVTIFLLSDSIVIVSENFEKVKKGTQAFYTWGILNDFWLRGAITRGSITEYDMKSIAFEDKIVLPFLGEGYLKAYKLESTLNISGIIIDDAFFSHGATDLDLKEDVDYVEYEEYLPKRGYEGKKRLLLPKSHSVVQIIDTMYYEEMLKSHVEDIDKYINTFCFFIKFLLDIADLGTVKTFLQKVVGNLKVHSQRVLIPSKVVIIFVALMEGLINRYRSEKHKDYSNAAMLEIDISLILGALKDEGYLPAFIDYLLDYDKKMHTSLYKDINNLRSNWQTFM